MFLFTDDWTNQYFSLPSGYILDLDHNSVSFHSFNDENYYHSLPELDLSHVYFHWDLNSTANGFVCEIVDNGNDQQANKNDIKNMLLIQ